MCLEVEFQHWTGQRYTSQNKNQGFLMPSPEFSLRNGSPSLLANPKYWQTAEQGSSVFLETSCSSQSFSFIRSLNMIKGKRNLKGSMFEHAGPCIKKLKGFIFQSIRSGYIHRVSKNREILCGMFSKSCDSQNQRLLHHICEVRLLKPMHTPSQFPGSPENESSNSLT